VSSGLTFPALPGLNWNSLKTPVWSSKIQTSVNGKELRAALFSRPRWKFSLSYEVLRADTHQELQNLMGFFMLMKGSFDDFYYVDSTDNAAADVQFGIGDGSTRTFPISRPIGGYTDGVLVNGSPTVKVGGATTAVTTTYGINDSAVTFAAAPAIGAVLTWSGNFYFRCRFLADAADFENFMYQLWQMKKLELITIK